MADLKTLIKQGEGISVEFKECRRTRNRDVYKTVCAFLNRHGGTLLLGVADVGEVIGVDPVSVEQIKKYRSLGAKPLKSVNSFNNEVPA